MGSAYSSEDEAAAGASNEDMVSDIVKTVPGPRREDGDGMELPPTAAVHNSNTVQETSLETAKESMIVNNDGLSPMSPSPSSKKIVVAEAGLVLDKLPPIVDKVDLPPTPLTSQAVVKQRAKVYPRGSYPPTHKKAKEAKFVPYEPYKGAVAHMQEKKQGIHDKYMSFFEVQSC